MVKIKRSLLILLIGVLCSVGVFAKSNKDIVLATTTSVRDSGLMDYLIPTFESETGYKVKLIAVGTGKALQMGRDGEADVLLVHAKPSELKFMEDGHGKERREVFHNYFVIVGPKDNLKMSSVEDALGKISEEKLNFASRGDNSGTNKKELQLWKENKITPKGGWYIISGSGMGATLKIASEMQAYTLTDMATYLNLSKDLDLEIKVGEDQSLLNQYGVITIDPSKNKYINAEGAKVFMDWISSEAIKDKVGKFGVEKFGMSLFVPDRKN
ncbi:substrate-binding domain-containing protein [uncultured Ilyobacter sp.]|uniref:substrate-binding domain-containing protein n=1 Tax=uncultured Ilyobacter sp. TaxID=544433 RepID=UPI0029F54D27|nr:substrate-binding domain-containing protein [uncultured Ilyobacter sp.]